MMINKSGLFAECCMEMGAAIVNGDFLISSKGIYPNIIGMPEISYCPYCGEKIEVIV